MAVLDRLSAEKAFHDRQAQQRASDLDLQPNGYRVDDDVYLDHESWIRPAFAALGDVAGLRVLDLGCGHGMASVLLARRGAKVSAMDLSHGYVAEAKRRAEANGVMIGLAQADAERHPFADQTFDRIWGNAVLHHLDVAVAGRELRRILRPDGWAVICEPWGENPLLRWARRRLPYQAKERTQDEQPLQAGQLRQLQAIFSQVKFQGFQLLSMVRRLRAPARLVSGLDWCDAMLLERVPSLQQYCRYVVLTLRP
jgi:2-polyprenyl-3-methyl-5-hydroxy-6-metoxy-1,4-benzoquinol methylase